MTILEKMTLTDPQSSHEFGAAFYTARLSEYLNRGAILVNKNGGVADEHIVLRGSGGLHDLKEANDQGFVALMSRYLCDHTVTIDYQRKADK